MLWERIFSYEFPEKVAESKGVCLIPIGAIEGRGPHLTVGSDTLTALARCRAAAELEPCVVFPPLYFAEASGGELAPGTICYSDELILDVLEQSCYEAYRNGFKKIYLVSGTAENNGLLQNFCRMMLQKNPDFLIFTGGFVAPGKGCAHIVKHKEEYPWLTDEDVEVIRSFADDKKKDLQGGFFQTGVAWGAHEASVRPDLFAKAEPDQNSAFAAYRALGLYIPHARFIEMPSFVAYDKHEGLNERIAKAFFSFSASLLAKNIQFLKEETVSTEYHKQWLAKQKAMPQK